MTEDARARRREQIRKKRAGQAMRERRLGKPSQEAPIGRSESQDLEVRTPPQRRATGKGSLGSRNLPEVPELPEEDRPNLPRRGTKAWFDSEGFEFNRKGKRVNKDTGLEYEAIGKVAVDPNNGRAEFKIDVGDDPIEAAKRFIPHARVPYSKEEIARLRAKKVAEDARKAREREEYLSEIGALKREAKEPDFYDPEADED